jgi:hypothetical protein
MPRTTSSSVSPKPGVYTTEFWITAATSAVTWLGSAINSGALPPTLAVKVQAFLAAGYAVSRGLAKIFAPPSQ